MKKIKNQNQDKSGRKAGENPKAERKDKIKKQFLEKVESLMREKNCKQADIVNKTGIAQSKLSNILSYSESTLPDLVEITELAEFFGVSVDELLGRGRIGKTDISTYGIAQTLADWFSAERISFGEVAIKEFAPPELPQDYDGPDIEPNEYIEREFKYPAIIFPVYQNSFFPSTSNEYLNTHFIIHLKNYESAKESLNNDDLQALVDKRLRSLKSDIDKCPAAK